MINPKYKLSDAFINPRDDGEFEFTATVYNINLGKNKDLLDSCEPLKGYSTFVYRVRKNEKTMPLEEAIKSCINDGILRDVLSEEKEAVMNSVLYGFTAKEEREYQKMMLREAREEGLEQGRTEERQNTEAERRRADIEKRRADAAEAELAKYKDKFGEIKE